MLDLALLWLVEFRRACRACVPGMIDQNARMMLAATPKKCARVLCHFTFFMSDQLSIRFDVRARRRWRVWSGASRRDNCRQTAQLVMINAQGKSVEYLGSCRR
jgi:hypothetical protein